MPIENHFSYAWKNSLKCREISTKLLERKFKSENQTSLWFDSWNNGKSMINLLGCSNLYQFGGASTKVQSIIQNSTWNTQSQPAASIFNSTINKIEISSSLDEDIWIWKLSSKGKFSFKYIWDYIKEEEMEVDWFKIIWNTTNYPQMAFCTYFAIINLLPTREKCAKWDKNNGNTNCLLCKTEIENIDHLFFNCQYSRHMWFITKRKINLNQRLALQNTRDSIQHIQKTFKGKKIEFNKASIVLTTVVVFMERKK